MSDQDIESVLKLIVRCAKTGEMTGSQLDLIEYLDDLMYKVGYDPGSVSIDVSEMPWNACSIEDDKKYLQEQLAKVKEPGVSEALRVNIDQETIFPLLDKYSEMIGMFDPDSSDRKYEADEKKAKLRFKKDLGWKACCDEERGIYTAERGGRGFYQLCEIDKEIYDRLDPAGKTGEDPDKLICGGRVLFEADDDYYTMPYCTVIDENYNELAPWSRAKARYNRTYNQ